MNDRNQNTNLQLVLTVFCQILHKRTLLLRLTATPIGLLLPCCISATEPAASPVLVLQTGHGGFIRSLDTSSDSKIAVTGADDGSIRIWRLPSGFELRRIAVGAPVHAVAISPDGRSVAAVCYQSVSVWDIETGKRQNSWSYFASDFYITPGVAFNRDGANVIVADSGRVFVWNRKSTKLLHSELFKFGITCFAAQPRRGVVALCQGASVILWNTESFKAISTIGPPKSTFPLSPEFVVSFRDQMKQVNAKREKEVPLPEEPNPAWVLSVVFGEDSDTVLTNHFDWSLRIWNATNGTQSLSLKCDVEDNLAVVPWRNTYGTVTSDKVTLRNMKTGATETELNPPKSAQSGVVVALFS